jgi:hypothetical protein
MNQGETSPTDVLSATGGPSTPQWYSRAAVDAFLAAADDERRRLEATIADAQARLARAASAVGLQQTVVEMMLDAQREVADIRRSAEIASAGILVPTVRDSAGGATSGDAGAVSTDPAATAVPSAPEVGIAAAPTAVSADDGARPTPPTFVDPLGGRPRAERDDVAFFEYLKDELDRDEPLGPTQP